MVDQSRKIGIFSNDVSLEFAYQRLQNGISSLPHLSDVSFVSRYFIFDVNDSDSSCQAVFNHLDLRKSFVKTRPLPQTS